MKKRFLTNIIFVTILLLLPIVTFAAIGIKPLTIHLTPKRGETVPFTFEMISKNKLPEQVKLGIYGQKQKLNGDLSFFELKPEDSEESHWVKLDRTEILLRPGESVPIHGTLKVPFNTKGSHNIVVMVDPQERKKSGSVILNVRYAVRLDIQVDAPGVSPAAQVKEFEIGKGEKGEPVIYALVQNTSLVDYPTYATAVLRDLKTKRLIEKIEIRPESGWRNNKTEMRMFAGNTLKYYGSPKKAILPGEYDLRLFYRYASAGQILQNKNISIKAGDYKYPAAKLRNIWVTPETVAFEGRPGAIAMKGIKFENKSNKSLNVSIEPAEIELEYPYSILNNTTLEFKPGKEFTLEPGRMSVVVVGVKYPKDIVVQGNYGLLKVKVTSNDSNAQNVEEFVINMEALVSGKYKKEAEVTNLSCVRDGSKYLLSAVIKNKGNVKIAPTTEVMFKNSTGKIIATTKLPSEDENTPAVLPAKITTLTGSIANLKPGLYIVEMKIIEGSTELGTSYLNHVEVK